MNPKPIPNNKEGNASRILSIHYCLHCTTCNYYFLQKRDARRGMGK